MRLYLMLALHANGRTWLDPLLRPLERMTYRLMGLDPNKEQDWKQYTFAMLFFSLVGCVFTNDSEEHPNWRSLSSKLTWCLDDFSGFYAPPTEHETSELHLRVGGVRKCVIVWAPNRLH
jgi:hypothetical protein